MQQVDIIRRVSGPYNLDTYFLVCGRTRKTIIIDPGAPVVEVIEFIREHDMVPDKILNTHGHPDQFFSTDEFKKVFPIPSCLHSADEAFFRDPDVRAKTKKAVGLTPPYPADVRLEHDDEISFGAAALTVIHTPGHTPGSACFLCGEHLFTGDTLFIGEGGRTDLPGGNLPELIESIRTRILPLGSRTIIHPGHHREGDPAHSTLEKEMKDNIYITDFILDE